MDIRLTPALALGLDLGGAVGAGVGGDADGRGDDLVLLPDELDDVGGVAGDDAGARALDHLGQLGVEPELVLGHGPDDVDVVLARQVVHLPDARVVCKELGKNLIS